MNNEARCSEEFLASFCVPSRDKVAEELSELSALAKSLEASFRYWEIVYVVSERYRDRARLPDADLLLGRNLRIIIVRDDVTYFRRRAIAASEAIGDVVVISGFGEVNHLDVAELASDAYASNEITLTRRTNGLPSLFIGRRLLDVISSHRINGRDLQTIALPRDRLNALFLRSTLTLDLRFEPKRAGLRYDRKLIHAPRLRDARMGDRLDLLVELILTSLPRFLGGYAALSFFVAFLALCYGAYAIAVITLKSHVAEGWFSTAMVQSGSVGFLAIGFGLLGLGLRDIADRLTGRSRDTILDEVANTNLFSSTRDGNVEVVRRPHDSADRKLHP